MDSECRLGVLVPAEECQAARRLLNDRGWFDEARRVVRLRHPGLHAGASDCTSADPVPADAGERDTGGARRGHRRPAFMGIPILHAAASAAAGEGFTVADIPAAPSKKQRGKAPRAQLRAQLRELMGTAWSAELDQDLPTKWERHGDLVMLPKDSFSSAAWERCGGRLWPAVAAALRAERVAIQADIDSGGTRSPHARLVFGEGGLVRHTDNGVHYEFDVTRCMFAKGNITEKLRVAALPCEGETVVDLYAGIGYFTLPYLVHAGASRVIACEWNPWALTALRHNLEVNGVAARCTVLDGDNAKTCPEGLAHRVNLGLIPTSAPGWPVAVRALRPEGGWLHLHENVEVDAALGRDAAFAKAGDSTARALKELFCARHGHEWSVAVRHIERVKSYAPRIFHLVFDIHCQPEPRGGGALV